MQHEAAPKKQHEKSTNLSPQPSTALDSLSSSSAFHDQEHAFHRPHRQTMMPNTILQLQRSIGNRAVQRLLTGTRSTPALQRASDYNGVMPGHDTYGDSYMFNGKTSDKFTYHHIIPENKLDLITNALEIIKKYFKALKKNEDNVDLRGENDSLNSETQTLITGAQAGWLKTRITNLMYAINKEYKGDGLSVTEEDVRTILTDTDPTVPALFTKFKNLLKKKEEVRRKPFEGIKAAATEALKSERLGSFYDSLRYNPQQDRDPGKIKTKLQTIFAGKDLDFDVMTTEIIDYLKTIPKSRRSERLNKNDVREAIYASAQVAFDAFFGKTYPFVVSESVTGDALKGLVQKHAMPHGEEKHLELAVQWNPGNIHRGPSSSYRLNPDDGAVFNELLDDGGDTFEKAAQNLVEQGHYDALVALNGAVDTFLIDDWVATSLQDSNKNPAPDLQIETVKAAKAIVKKMQGIQKFGTTKFKGDQWEMHGTKKMRLKAPPKKPVDTVEGGETADNVDTDKTVEEGVKELV